MQIGWAVDVSYTLVCVDQVHTEYVRHRRQRAAIRATVADDGLVIVAEDRIQRALRCRGEEMPVDGATTEMLPVLCHDVRRVVRRIEAHAHESHVGLHPLIGRQSFLDLAQHVGRERASVDVRAGGVNETQYNRLAVENPMQVDRRTSTVEQGAVSGVPDRRQRVGAGFRGGELERGVAGRKNRSPAGRFMMPVKTTKNEKL